MCRQAEVFMGSMILFAAACALNKSDEVEVGLNFPSPDEPQEVDPSLSDYSCVEISDYPWMTAYDIRHDGRFGGDDLRAYFDRKISDRDDACLGARMGMIGEEVGWKLQDMIARQNMYTEAVLLAEIDGLEGAALAALSDLARKVEMPLMEAKARTTIVETCLRARNIVHGAADEPFGVGFHLVRRELGDGKWALEVRAVHPQSEALSAGVKVGDLITAVDDVPIFRLSVDDTDMGLIDPQTQLIRGMSGPRDSAVRLTISRGQDLSVVTVKRNIWSARSLGVKNTTPLWDGTEISLARPDRDRHQ